MSKQSAFSESENFPGAAKIHLSYFYKQCLILDSLFKPIYLQMTKPHLSNDGQHIHRIPPFQWFNVNLFLVKCMLYIKQFFENRWKIAPLC